MKRSVFVLSLLAGCTYPQTSANIVDSSPHLFVANAQPNAMLSIDGHIIGPAIDYRPGLRALKLPSGTHRISVVDGVKQIFDNDVYFGDGTDRTINLPD
jgi:hypothetical protein